MCVCRDDGLYRCFAPFVINGLLLQWVHPSILYFCTLGQFFVGPTQAEEFQ